MDVHIRPCLKSECSTVLKLWEAASVNLSPLDTSTELARLIAENGELFLVAERDGEIVGSVIGGWDGWRGNLYRLAVLPGHRGQGIGRLLVEAVEQRLAAKGAKRLSALVRRDDPDAVARWDSLKDLGYYYDERMVRYAKHVL